MTRNNMKRKKHKITQKPKRNQNSEKSLFKKVSISILKIIAGISVVINLWIFFKPNISIEPTIPLDQNNPLHTPFSVCNNSYFSIYDVKVGCAPRYVRSSNYVDVASYYNDFSSEIFKTDHIAKKIKPGERYTQKVPLISLKGLSAEYADIAIIATFRYPLFCPIRHKIKYRFVTITSDEGISYWVQEPIDK